MWALLSSRGLYMLHLKSLHCTFPFTRPLFEACFLFEACPSLCKYALKTGPSFEVAFCLRPATVEVSRVGLTALICYIKKVALCVQLFFHAHSKICTLWVCTTLQVVRYYQQRSKRIMKRLVGAGQRVSGSSYGYSTSAKQAAVEHFEKKQQYKKPKGCVELWRELQVREITSSMCTCFDACVVTIL